MFAEVIEVGVTFKAKMPFIKVKISADSFRTIWNVNDKKVGDFIEVLIDASNNCTVDNSTADTTKVVEAKKLSNARRAAWGD